MWINGDRVVNGVPFWGLESGIISEGGRGGGKGGGSWGSVYQAAT